jgi:hypothetical protein
MPVCPGKICFLVYIGHAIARSHRVRCEICCRQSVTWADISPSLVILPLISIILPLFHAYLSLSLEICKGSDPAPGWLQDEKIKWTVQLHPILYLKQKVNLSDFLKIVHFTKISTDIKHKSQLLLQRFSLWWILTKQKKICSESVYCD